MTNIREVNFDHLDFSPHGQIHQVVIDFDYGAGVLNCDYSISATCLFDSNFDWECREAYFLEKILKVGSFSDLSQVLSKYLNFVVCDCFKTQPTAHSCLIEHFAALFVLRIVQYF